MAEVVSQTTCVKHPDESLLYSFDFADLLESGETLSAVTGVEEVGTSDLTIGSGSISGDTVTARISGGTRGQTYLVQCTVTTSTSNTRVGQGRLFLGGRG